MKESEFASLLFFTSAAVEADPGLANASLAGAFEGWGSMRGNQVPLGADKDFPPLTFAELLRVWADPAVARDCPDCRAPALFLHGQAGGMLAWHFKATWICPFCGKIDEVCVKGNSVVHGLVHRVEKAIQIVRTAEFNPPGLPFCEAVARLRAMRDADFLDPAHPLEARSLALAVASRPFQQGGPLSLCAAMATRRADAVRDVRIRAELVTPERLATARKLCADLLDKQSAARAAAEAELDSIRASAGGDGYKGKLHRGEITLEAYRETLARKRELTKALRPTRIAAERADALCTFLRQELGRAPSDTEQRIFLECLA